MSRETFISSDIFKPCNFPEHTYIARESQNGVDYEQRLNFALTISGTLVSIIGASKMGKTVLCEKVIPFEKQVSISGADFSNGEEFWNVIANKIGLPTKGTITECKKISEDEDHSKVELFTLTKDAVINDFVDNGRVLILDDFHYAPTEVQEKIAYHLKDAIRRDFKAIIVSLPHRADTAIRKNSDLSGRLSLIDIEVWKIEELKEIAIKGFSELGVEISDEIAEKIATESLTSPQLMQYICLSICVVAGVDQNATKTIKEDILEKAYKLTNSNLDYAHVVNLISEGPLSKGKPRSRYKTKLGDEMDLYQLVIESLSKNPPLMKLTIDIIKERIIDIIDDGEINPDRQKIKNTLNQIKKLISDKENIYRVLEWKDEGIYVTDPLFLFYLRWGR